MQIYYENTDQQKAGYLEAHTLNKTAKVYGKSSNQTKHHLGTEAISLNEFHDMNLKEKIQSSLPVINK